MGRCAPRNLVGSKPRIVVVVDVAEAKKITRAGSWDTIRAYRLCESKYIRTSFSRTCYPRAISVPCHRCIAGFAYNREVCAGHQVKDVLSHVASCPGDTGMRRCRRGRRIRRRKSFESFRAAGSFRSLAARSLLKVSRT